jgi:choice-of-anchor B domain-containing protein
MKKSLLSAASILFTIINIQAQSLNMNLLSTWQDANASAYNDISGYNANGREYAIIGSNYATHYIDITDPQNPVHCDTEPGLNTNTAWRDIVIYQHYAYVVNDAGNGTLQIFDLNYLPDSVHKVYDSNEFSESTHACYRENDRLYLASNRRNGVWYPIDILSLADPENPTLIGTVDIEEFNNSMHEVYVKNDTLYASAGFPGLYIFDVADASNPLLIQSFTTYPDNGYNHTAAVSPDNRLMCFTDEVPLGLSVKLYDVLDMDNPELMSTFYSNEGATGHNPFFVTNKYLVISYYHDGVWVWNVEDPENPVVIGYYDTYPDNPGDYSGYEGCWGVFPYLNSTNIIASDISYGLFVMSAPYSLNADVKKNNIQNNNILVYPSIINENKLYLANMENGFSTVEFYNMLGDLVYSYEFMSKKGVNVISNLDLKSSGIYNIHVKQNDQLVKNTKINYLK